ncbi:MAG: histidine kinase [Rariglobus sp.]|jgi:signal transduction histidine kinase/CheY-like chemotaxis protein|nr:histidine kinase [Rariglobus sp.]
MTTDLLTVELGGESHVALARRRAREIADLLGFEQHDCLRIATVVSEVARTVSRRAGGGRVEFCLGREEGDDVLDITIRDSRPGAAAHDETGLLSLRRFMSRVEVNTSAQGTVVRLGKNIPRCFMDPLPVVAARVSGALLKLFPPDSASDIEKQDRELIDLLLALDKSESERAQLNRELEETYRGVSSLYAELDYRAQEIHKAVELKSRFLSNITHEFRTPLHSIISLSRMLLERIDGELTAEQEKQARFINRAARDLSELVNDLLDLAKADAGKIQVTPAVVSVNELFATLRGMLRPLVENNTAVTLVFDAPEPLEIVSDERKLSQILRNLVSNALKYTQEGEVRVSASVEGPRVIFCVRDTGIGIPAEHQDKVFEEFYQVQNPFQQKIKGTGLGLALSRRLAEMLGGGIRLESTVGRGSTFWVDLPLAISPESASTAPLRRAPEKKDIPQIVLFVDDRPDALFSYEHILDHTPFKAVLTRTTQEAIDVLKRVSVSAIVTNSASSIRLLAASWPPPRASLPAFIVTGDDRPADTDAHLVDAFLPATPRTDQLVACLGKLHVRSRLTAIVVDASSDARQLLRTVLEEFQLNVLEVETAGDAVVMLQERRPALVFTDVVLPDDSGIRLIARLQKAAQNGSLIIHSSQVFSDEERDYLRQHATTLIRKGPPNDSVYRTALIHEIARARRRHAFE